MSTDFIDFTWVRSILIYFYFLKTVENKIAIERLIPSTLWWLLWLLRSRNYKTESFLVPRSKEKIVYFQVSCSWKSSSVKSSGYLSIITQYCAGPGLYFTLKWREWETNKGPAARRGKLGLLKCHSQVWQVLWFSAASVICHVVGGARLPCIYNFTRSPSPSYCPSHDASAPRLASASGISSSYHGSDGPAASSA